jgi:hypothetical protein
MNTNHVEAFGDAQEILYTYIDWLHRSGRLTEEEHFKLLNVTTDCIMRAVSFGSEEAAS